MPAHNSPYDIRARMRDAVDRAFGTTHRTGDDATDGLGKPAAREIAAFND